MRARDERDSSRGAAPLRRADGRGAARHDSARAGRGVCRGDGRRPRAMRSAGVARALRALAARYSRSRTVRDAGRCANVRCVPRVLGSGLLWCFAAPDDGGDSLNEGGGGRRRFLADHRQRTRRSGRRLRRPRQRALAGRGRACGVAVAGERGGDGLGDDGAGSGGGGGQEGGRGRGRGAEFHATAAVATLPTTASRPSTSALTVDRSALPSGRWLRLRWRGIRRRGTARPRVRPRPTCARAARAVVPTLSGPASWSTSGRRSPFVRDGIASVLDGAGRDRRGAPCCGCSSVG